MARRPTRTRSRRNKSQEIRDEVDEIAPSIEHVPLDIAITKALKEYGTYVLEDRAIPAIQDGCKPSQRRVLWTLFHVFNSSPSKTYLKCARVAGGVTQFHPHGSTYGTLVNMVEGTPTPLVTGYGNFGSYSKFTPAAADRYTECRLSWFTLKLMFDPRFTKTIPMIPNYDGSAVEPVYLPTQLPLVLAMGHSGIAMATTTSIPSFSVESLFSAVKLAIRARKKGYLLTAKRLASVLEMTSPYGGVMDSTEEELIELFETGTGSIDWKCAYEISGNELNITGLAPGWNFDSKMDKIREIPSVAECADISEGKGIRIRITFKRLSADDLEVAQDKVIKLLSSKVHYRINVTERFLVEDPLVNTSGAKFRSYGIPELLANWTEKRVRWEKDALKHEHEELRAKIQHHKLMLHAHNNLDIIFAILKKRGKVDKVALLSKQLDISEEDARTIWAIPVGRLDKLVAAEITEKVKALLARNKEVRHLFKNPELSIDQHMTKNMSDLTSPVAYAEH